jgi:UDP-N-acetylglucosamine 4-epimerase
MNQKVVGLDNFSTGHQGNLNEVQRLVTTSQWQNFNFKQSDICDLNDCLNACDGVDFVLHHAALGGVYRSVEDPITTNASNVSGFLNILVAARNAKVKRFVYAASSSIYGKLQSLPSEEQQIGAPTNPYAVTKYVNELYADVFGQTYGLPCIGLRYSNVFGPRQDPEGAFAAVIPKWINSMINGEPVYILGDGKASRDFCYVSNVVQANLLAGYLSSEEAVNQIYNIAVGDRTNLNELYLQIKKNLLSSFPDLENTKPVYRESRAGDIQHSLASIDKAKEKLGYEPTHKLGRGLDMTVQWHLSQSKFKN